jgi:hypothetical protein
MPGCLSRPTAASLKRRNPPGPDDPKILNACSDALILIGEVSKRAPGGWSRVIHELEPKRSGRKPRGR